MAEIRQKHFFYLWEDKGVAGGGQNRCESAETYEKIKVES